MDPIDIHEQN